MISVSQALESIVGACPDLPVIRVPIDRSIGRVLREEITAPNDFPPYHRVMMDGYAVRVEDLAVGDTLPLVGESAAGTSGAPKLRPGTCVQVMTGAPLPAGADAVVKVEETERFEQTVRFTRPVQRGQHYAVRAEEAREGATIVQAGTVITPVTVATIAHAGRSEVLVSRLPSLAIVSTGDELVAVDEQPGRNQIRDTNSWSLAAQAAVEGLTEVRRLWAPDDESRLEATFTDALNDDIVVVSGGVSMGKYDLVPGVLDRLEVEEIFHRIACKPGKPVWFGRHGDTLVFGAPGNPLSTAVAFHLYVRPAIARMTGRDPREPRYVGVLASDQTYRCKRELFAFVRADWTGEEWSVTPLPGMGSADVFAPAAANALLCLPMGTHPLQRDQEVSFSFLGPGPGRQR